MNAGRGFGCCLAGLLVGLICSHDASGGEGVPMSGLQLWLRADQAGELDQSGQVATWANRAPGATQRAVQSQASWRPQWLRAVAELRDQPALEFDGKDDFLHLPWLQIGPRTTLFLVAENAAQTEGGSYWRTVLGGDDDSFRDGATKYGFGFRRAGFEPLFIANLYYAPGKPHLLIPPAIPPSPAAFHLYGFRHQGEATEGMSLRVDGAAVASVTADPLPPGFPGTGYVLGQGGHLAAGKRFRFYRGRIAEVLIYDRPLAEIEMLRVEAYLAEKYGLPRVCAPPTRGLVLWLSADSLASAEAGSPIDRWEDQSGQGHHAVQDDANRRPRYLPRGINRRPAVDFRDALAQFELADWRPPEDGATFAAVRAAPHERGKLVRDCPAIDPRWTSGQAAFRGQLAELLVYNRTLTEDEADCVEQYLAHRYSETADPRWFDNGTRIFHDGYADQPYVVRCQDGSWLCVLTTSRHDERGADRTLAVTRSRDRGKTWSPAAYAIEPPELRQPSWGTLYAAPYGRVYVFYNLRESAAGAAPIGLFFKYSDDHGASWSAERYRIPIRALALDRQLQGISGWSVCPPIDVGGDVLVSYTRFGAAGKRSLGQGFVFRSDNLQTERDPQRIRWEMLPAGDVGIRAEHVPSDMQEEHIITPLDGDDLFCIWRSTSGFACHSYSRDGGRTWGERGWATYEPDGRRIRQPLACCRPYRTADGRYLLWFHNAQPQSETAAYRPRDIVWLAGGQLRDGHIHWSQPELLLYSFDSPVRGLGMSYPDFIEQDGRLWVTTTDKEDARIFEVDPALLAGLWGQDSRRELSAEGLLLELAKAAPQADRSPQITELPSLLHGGLTISFTFRLDSLRPGQTLVECRSAARQGWRVTTVAGERLQIELADGRHPAERWATDHGLLQAGQTHQVTFIVDGGPNLILALVDGVLCDGGDRAPQGWGRFSRRLAELAGDGATLQLAPELDGSIERLRLYARPLRVAEAISLYQHDAGPAAVSKVVPSPVGDLGNKPLP